MLVICSDSNPDRPLPRLTESVRVPPAKAAFHPLIHIAMGLEAESAETVADGVYAEVGFEETAPCPVGLGSLGAASNPTFIRV